jgi:hypothetical protein
VGGAAYVKLVLDLYDPQGSPLNRGHAVLTPSLPLTDVPDMQVIPPAPVTAGFTSGGPPVVTLLASDSPGPQPAGWAWDIKPVVPGGLEPWSIFVPAGPVPFTATSASPAVFTWTPGSNAWDVRSLPDGTAVQLSGTSLPGGFQAGATYFVTGSSGDTVRLAAVQGGPALGSLSAGSGELTVARWRLSALTPVQPVQLMGGYLTLPSGTPSAGQVPVATGSGTATRWGAGTGDKTYSQAFSVASSVVVPHNLQKYPAVTVLDSAGDEVIGDIEFTDLNNLIVSFSAPFSGTVTCN